MQTAYVATGRTIEIANMVTPLGGPSNAAGSWALFPSLGRGEPIPAEPQLYLLPLALIVELEAKLKVPRRQGSLDYSKVSHSES